MRFIPRLHRYFIVEILRGSLSAFAAVFIIVSVGMLFSYWQDGYAAHLLTILGYSIPQIFVFAVPVSFFAGIVLALGRVASEQEFTLLRACGVGLSQVYIPLAFFSLLVTSLLLVIWDRVVPWGEAHIRATINEAAFDALKGLDGKERRRVVMPNMEITFFETTGRNLRPISVIQSDETTKRMIYADNFNVTFPPDESYVSIELVHGFITDETDENLPKTNFNSLTFDIPGPKERKPDVYINRNLLSLTGVLFEAARIMDVASHAANPLEAQKLERVARRHVAHFHYIVATSVAPLFLLFVAVPLALLLGRGGRVIGISAAVLFIFAVYYPLLLGGRHLAESGAPIASWISLNLPNIGAVIVGAFLQIFIRK